QAVARGRLRPLAVTWLVAALGVLLGSLDLLAPVLSHPAPQRPIAAPHISVLSCRFWLTSCLLLNLSCALQGLLPTPGWAPGCPLYHWAVSLAGSGLCLALMLTTCWSSALLAMAIAATTYKYLQYRG
ncbi:S12A6 protein, partial [Bucco capensis]|nr:S12A6 protein [Bucco capensis]